MSDKMTVAARIKGITKQYPGSEKKANSNISLDLYKGEILCIAGENGAGKTTLMKILCGLEKADSGEIIINENEKIGMLHQHFMLFPEYTVAENIVMGNMPLKWGLFFDSKKARFESEKIIKENNFQLESNTKVKELTLGLMQQVEICRILYQNAKIIILDEPTSILSEQEALSLFKTLKELVSQGKSIILITHKLREIKNNCNRVAVLKQGEIKGVFNAEDIDEKKIASMMTGTDFIPFETAEKNELKQETQKKNIIAFENVTVKRKGQKRPLLEDVSFSVDAGEILGFAGVGGNGLGVIEAVLGGFLHPAQGKVLHNGKDISSLNIRRLRNDGLAFVPSDRIKVGSAVEATIEENIIINNRHNFINKIFFDKKKVKDYSQKLMENYNIEGAAINKKGSFLSGGNLQKLILAREINCIKDYIVFSEPTWGLDIASSRFVMNEIKALPQKGAAVILISTNLDEVLSLSDRIIVMYRGKISGVFVNTKDETIKEKIGDSMQGITGEVK